MEGGVRMLSNVKRYDVLLVNFGEDTIDSEQSGVRPAIVASSTVISI